MTRKPNRLPVNFWDRLDALPPVAVRLLAKKSNKKPMSAMAMSDEEISVASGLSMKEVRFLSTQIDWSCVDVHSARVFLKACKVDVTSRKDMMRVNDYLRSTPAPRWKYILHSDHYETTFKPLLKLYAGLK